MWNVCWDSKNERNIASQDKVIELIECINEEYKHKEPVIVQVESECGKILCIGVGTGDEFSCLDFFPDSNGLGSMHPVPQSKQKSKNSVVFWLDSYDSEWEADLLIPYNMAIKELRYFLKYNDVSSNYIWELD